MHSFTYCGHRVDQLRLRWYDPQSIKDISSFTEKKLLTPTLNERTWLYVSRFEMRIRRRDDNAEE